MDQQPNHRKSEAIPKENPVPPFYVINSKVEAEPKSKALISGFPLAFYTQSYFSAPPANHNSFDTQIESHAEEAREKFYAAIQGMPEVELPLWLNRLLERSIIPTLKRIGFDESFCWVLFKMAAPSWELLGPITDEEIWLHPILMKDIEKIRSGILWKTRKNSEYLSVLAGMNSQDLHSLAKKSTDPANLFALLEDISTPWIILPRAYDHLEKHHSHFLRGYLKYLNREQNSEFTRILTRIITEFIGNYTLKFINKIHPKDEMIDAIFYGYATMFWENLRRPSNGLEDGRNFENFLHWVKNFKNRFFYINCDMAMTIESMEDGKEKAFPVMNAFGLACDTPDDPDRFLVTLRHGSPGIEAAIKYFAIGSPLLKDATDGHLPYTAVPAALSVLFREIKKHYHTETLRAQEFIREFLLKLGAAYDLTPINPVSADRQLPEQLRFVGPRVLSMVHDLSKTIRARGYN
jgi:hypothetical protein